MTPVATGNNHWNMGAADNLSLTLSASGLRPAELKPPKSKVPPLDHVFFVMMENKNYGDIIGNSSAPHINAMGNAHVILGNSNGALHPSDPNYWTIAGGSTFGHASNPFPKSTATFNSPHIGQRAEDAGKTWRSCGQSAKFACDLQRHELDSPKGAYYDPDNRPFLFFKDLKSTKRCEDKLPPLTKLFEDLKSVSTTPNFVWFEPDSCNSMHDGPCRDPSSGPDRWVKDTTDKIFASLAWKTKKSLLVFTYDEDWGAGTQRIPTIVAGSPDLTMTGFVSKQHVTTTASAAPSKKALASSPSHRTTSSPFPSTKSGGRRSNPAIAQEGIARPDLPSGRADRWLKGLHSSRGLTTRINARSRACGQLTAHELAARKLSADKLSSRFRRQVKILTPIS